jgi:hypothetical protein
VEANKRRWREIAGVIAAMALVLLAYREVAFAGKTFDTSGMTNGVNGFDRLHPPQFNGFRVDPGASAWQMVPWAEVVHGEIANGMLPMWTPYQGAGAPLAANAQSAVFDPLTLAVNLHPTPLTWDLSFLVVFLLGAGATYLFLRSLGLSLLAALAGTTAFIMSGYFATGNNLPFVRLYFYIPVLLLLADKVIASGRLRWVVAFATVVGACILGGMLEVALFVFTITLVYALYRLIRAPRRWAAAIRLGGGTALGFLLAAPLLVPFATYLPLSLNQHNGTAGVGHAARATLLNWLIPFVNGYPAALRVVRFGPDRSWLGAAGAVLLVVAIASPALMRRHAAWPFLGLGAVLLLKVHGFPGLGWMGRLPAYSQANFVAWAPGIVSFCFAVVVAVGVAALEDGAFRRRRLVLGVAVLGVIVLALLVANRPVLAAPLHKSPWRQYFLYAVALAAAGGVLAACVTSVWLPRFQKLAAPFAAGVLLVELLVMFAPGAYLPRKDPFRAPSWMPALKGGLAANPAARVFGFDQLLYPNTAGAFGIQDIRVLDGVDVQRYATFIDTFVTRFADRLSGDETTPSDVEANPMFDLLGVRYVLAGSTPVSEASGQFRLVEPGNVSIFENTHALPRAFVTGDIRAVGTTAAAVSYLRSLGHGLPDGRTRVDAFDPRTQAVVESPASAQVPSGSAGAPARAVTISSYHANEVTVDVAAGPPGLLVLTDTYVPGWQATVGGRAAEVLPTDIAFRGVAVGGAATRVVFRYRPSGVTLAWLLPLVGLVGVLVWWLVSRRRGLAAADTAAAA